MMALAEVMNDELFARPPIAEMTDAALLSQLHSFLGDSRQLLARLIRHLIEVQARELHRRRAYGTIVDFCTGELHLSQEDARLRASAVMVAKNFPVVIEMIERGETTLATLAILRRHLTKDNHMALLNEARGLSKRQVRLLVARPSFKPTIRGLALTTFARTTIPPNAAGSSRQVSLPFSLASMPSDQTFAEGLEAKDVQAHSVEGDADLLMNAPPVDAAGTLSSSIREKSCDDVDVNKQEVGSSRFSWRVVVDSKTQEKLERVARLLHFSSAAGALDRVLDHALDLVLDEIAQKEAESLTSNSKTSADEQTSRLEPPTVSTPDEGNTGEDRRAQSLPHKLEPLEQRPRLSRALASLRPFVSNKEKEIRDEPDEGSSMEVELLTERDEACAVEQHEGTTSTAASVTPPKSRSALVRVIHEPQAHFD